MGATNKKRDCTIIDIASVLKVSAATVSRALNDHSDISEGTKQRVRMMADKMGYHPNRLAAGLRQKKSNTIGIVVPMFTAIFHSKMITVIQNRLYEYGYHVLLCQSNDSLRLEKELVETLYSYRVDAIVASISLFTNDYTHFKTFMDSGTPVVFYDRVPTDDFSAHFVVSNDYKGGYLAGEHLVDRGCRKPAFICGPLSSNLYQDRNAGFRSALQTANISLKEEWVFYQELTHENALDVCQRIFSASDQPDAVFAANDTSAIAVLQYSREHGICIPDQLKLIGYSNDPRSEIVEPSITTIDQNIPQMADKVVNRLLSLLDSDHQTTPKSGITNKDLIDVRLIRRNST